MNFDKTRYRKQIDGAPRMERGKVVPGALSGKEREILRALTFHWANENGYCWPGDELLADAADCARETVCRLRSKLAAKGWVHCARRPNGGWGWTLIEDASRPTFESWGRGEKPTQGTRMERKMHKLNPVTSDHTLEESPKSVVTSGHKGVTWDQSDVTSDHTACDMGSHEYLNEYRKEPLTEAVDASTPEHSLDRAAEPTESVDVETDGQFLAGLFGRSDRSRPFDPDLMASQSRRSMDEADRHLWREFAAEKISQFYGKPYPDHVVERALKRDAQGWVKQRAEQMTQAAAGPKRSPKDPWAINDSRSEIHAKREERRKIRAARRAEVAS